MRTRLLIGADLRGRDLSHADLSGALLMGADLRGANLTGATLIGANLTGADLTGADLTGADLTLAYLTEALLVGATLRGAHLEVASFEGAQWHGAQLEGALMRRLPSEPSPCVRQGAWLTSAGLTSAGLTSIGSWGARVYRLSPPSHALITGELASPQVIALHGMMGGALDFEQLTLALDRSLLALDLLGHASTPARPLDEGPEDELEQERVELSFEQVTALSARWLEALIMSAQTPVELLGYSMGGRLALSVVVQWRREGRDELLSKLSGLTLLGASPGLEGEAERAARRASDEQWARRLEAGPLSEVLSDWSAQPLLAHLELMCPDVAHAQRERRLSSHRAHSLAAAMRALSTGAMPSLWDELKALPCPTRWVSGALDEKFCAIAKRASELQGERASLHLLPDVGHSAHLEAPQALAELLRGWLS